MARLTKMIITFLAAAVACVVQAAGEAAASDLDALANDDECAAGTAACGLAALQLRGTQLNASSSHPEEEPLEALPTRTCRQVLSKIDANRAWGIGFYKMDLNVGRPSDVTSSSIPFDSDEDVLRTFYDPDTTNIQISSTQVSSPCGEGWQQVLWFYPVADHNGAFNLNDFVCSRLAISTKSTGAACINVYRVRNVQEIDIALQAFHYPNSVAHVVIGGHGSNDPNGVLGLGSSDWDNVGQDAASTAMLRNLKTYLEDGATMFLDSCYSAMNGLAKYVSETVADVWVMGGIVSLDGSIDMLPGVNGPPRIVSDFPRADASVPEFVGGTQAIKMWGNGMDLGMVTNYGAPAWDPNP